MDDEAAYRKLLREVIKNQDLIDALLNTYGAAIAKIIIKYGYKGVRPRKEIDGIVERFMKEYSDVVINGVASAAGISADSQSLLLLPKLRNIGATTEHLAMKGFFRGYSEQVRKRFPVQPHPTDHRTFVGRVKRLQQGTANGIYAVMKDAVDQGLDPRAVAFRIQNSVLLDPTPSEAAVEYSKLRRVRGTYLGHGTPYGSVQFNAMRIVRTEMARTYRNSMYDFYEGKPYNEGYDWILSNRHKKTDRCNVFAASGPYAVRSEIPESHPMCVLPDTRLTTDFTHAAMKSWYKGPVVELQTANGLRLTVTANHMVLTDRGWITAQRLRKGHKVVNASALERGVTPHLNDQPATAEQVFRALRSTQSVATRRMPVSAMDFHGDGRLMDGDVDIVGTDGLLLSDFEAYRLQKNCRSVFRYGGSKLSQHAGDRDLATSLKSLSLAADGIVSIARNPHLLLGTDAAIGELDGLLGTTNYDVRLEQASGNSVPAHPEILTETFNALTGSVILDEVVSTNLWSFEGHVYDLSTASRAYIANGIITSNCLCRIAARVMSQEQLKALIASGGAID